MTRNPIELKWSTWDYCGNEKYVIGFAFKRHQGQATGLQLLCSNPANTDDKYMEFIGTLETPSGEYPALSNVQKCRGAGIGIVASFDNSNRLQDLQLLCSWTEHGSSNFTEDTGFKVSNLTAKELGQCPKGHAICGFQTEEQMSGLVVKCCKVPHPATLCQPINAWEQAGGIDNTLAKGK